MNQQAKYFVEIVQFADDDGPEIVIRKFGPFQFREAEKTKDGININLNSDAYFTRIIPA